MLYLHGITLLDRDPLYRGGFTDIYHALYRSEEVALKRLRIFHHQKDQDHQRLRRVNLAPLQVHCSTLTHSAYSETYERSPCMESAHKSTCTPIFRCGCRYIPGRSVCRFAVDASWNDSTIQKDVWRRKYQRGSTCRYFPSLPPSVVISGIHLTRTAQGNQSRHQLSSSGGCDSWGPQRRTSFAYQYLPLLERTH